VVKTALITGGSEGIGYALAKESLKHGYHVILSGRVKEKLKRAQENLQKEYPACIDTIVCDLSEQGSARSLMDALKGRRIDLLINNAGYGLAGKSWETDPLKDEKMIQVNDASMMMLTRFCAEQMTERREGVILNVASTGAFQPGPYIASYYASKSFVLSYTKAVREELKPCHVRVYCLCPGPVDTAFYEKSGGKKPWLAMEADAVGRYAFAHMKGKCLIIPGLTNRLVRLLPSGLRMLGVKLMKERGMKK
jgi:short-subunit dehydrogenase